MAEQSTGFWGLGKICVCTGLGNIRRRLSPKETPKRELISSKWTSCTALSREKNKIYAVTLVCRYTWEIVGFETQLLTKADSEFSV